MIYISSKNFRHPIPKTFTKLHPTTLHLSTLHFFPFKLHPTTLHKIFATLLFFHYTSFLIAFLTPFLNSQVYKRKSLN